MFFIRFMSSLSISFIIFFFVVVLELYSSEPKTKLKSLVYDTEVAVEKYFHYAQESRKQKKYRFALAYYDVIINNFQSNKSKIITAEYEKGYVYYTMKRFPQALEMFNKVIVKAENPLLAMHVSRAVLILSRDFKDEIEKKSSSRKNKKKKRKFYEEEFDEK